MCSVQVGKSICVLSTVRKENLCAIQVGRNTCVLSTGRKEYLCAQYR